jgi:hypothetical protein
MNVRVAPLPHMFDHRNFFLSGYAFIGLVLGTSEISLT